MTMSMYVQLKHLLPKKQNTISEQMNFLDGGGLHVFVSSNYFNMHHVRCIFFVAFKCVVMLRSNIIKPKHFFGLVF
jgi:hypothetical protein